MTNVTESRGRTPLCVQPTSKHWVNKRCHAVGCKRAGRVYGLCEEHQADVLGEVTADLSQSGVDWNPEHLIVHILPGMYLAVTRTDIKPRIQKKVHRIAMESSMGRPLLPGENVHHINGCRWDNSRANLELWVTSQPSGQRPADLAAYARRLLSIYGTESELSAYQNFSLTAKNSTQLDSLSATVS